jgi:hypothetical protein
MAQDFPYNEFRLAQSDADNLDGGDYRITRCNSRQHADSDILRCSGIDWQTYR